jgi:DNA invertase Pin-like site-specific DNA recombinase
MNRLELAKAQSQVKKAIIYVRVSTDEQVDNFSLDTQENICKREAKQRGLQIAQTFREEGRSARTI